jgi:hypothetical protein
MSLDLEERLADWRRQPWRQHLGALAVLLVLLTLRSLPQVFLGEPHVDEGYYIAAFSAVTVGESPYDIGGYYYPPFFAAIGAWVLERLGTGGTLVLFRSVSMLGLVLALWCSTAWLRGSWTRRVVVAAIYLLAAPAVGYGMRTGNISFAVVGVVLLALFFWRRRPVIAGLAVGASVAIKPIAPLSLVALFCHRPSPPGKSHLIAGLVGALTAAGFLMTMLMHLPEMSRQPIDPLSYIRSFSLYRMLALAGVSPSFFSIIVIGAALVAIGVRLRPLSGSQLICVATTGAILVTPVIWTHTLILVLPVQAIALVLAFCRWRRPNRGDAEGQRGRRIRFYELIVVALAAASIQLAGGIGALDDQAPWVQIAFLAVPYLAPAALTAYILALTDTGGRLRR